MESSSSVNIIPKLEFDSKVENVQPELILPEGEGRREGEREGGRDVEKTEPQRVEPMPE
jgi:hypothetical protein